MKKIFQLSFIFLFILAGLANAQNEMVTEIIDVSNEAEAGGTAEFQIKIKNHQNDRDIYRIFYNDLSIAPFSEFAESIKFENSQIKLDSEEEGIFDIKINVLDTTIENKNYETTVTISSLTEPEIIQDIILKTYVVSPEDIIMIFPDIPETIIPGEEYEIKIRLKNRANVKLVSYEVLVSSDLPQLKKNFITDFEPNEEIIETFKIKTGEKTKAKDYVVSIRVYDTESKTKGSYSSAITLIKSENIEEKTNEEKSFLSSTTTITKTNEGNIKTTQKIEVTKNFFERIFTDVNPEAYLESGKYVWEAELEPGEEFSAEITSNYRPIFYGIIIIIIATLIMIYLLDKSVILRKRMFKIKRTQEGLSELKILIHLRNGKPNELKAVRILDVLPKTLESTDEFGTMKPTKVQQGTKGKRLIWEIGDLAPGEERIISYKVKSNVRLIGETRLPPTMVQYTSKNGKVISERSSSISLEHTKANN
tara:strand:- start:86 stop:1519 length:1434 start_codon:yes stop_codon:yes gene_type:complete